MPAFRSHTVLEIARGIHAFFNLDVDLTRGTVPNLERESKQIQNRVMTQKAAERRNRKKQKIAGRQGNFRALPENIASRRRSIASQYLTGSGLEIGALHQPLEVPSDVTIRYVDRMPAKQLREQYSTLSKFDMVEVDIVDDGETLSSVAEDSVDFVIANHFIEHCQNPIATLESHLKVLKPGGVLYVAVPDKRFTFDRDRPVTSLEHLIRDYEEGPTVSANSHFEEWSRLVEKVPKDEVRERAQHLAKIDYSIHFHVWTQVAFFELLLYCQSSLRFPFEIELFQKNDFEFVCILRKQS